MVRKSRKAPRATRPRLDASHPQLLDAEDGKTVLRLNLLSDYEAERAQLRAEVLALASAQELEQAETKDGVRERHRRQRDGLIARKRDFLNDFEDTALRHFATGREIDPSRIEPRVTLVSSEPDNDLFVYASLHWSVPVTGGYGRRSRFLLRDSQNGKLIGIFALSDPVYNLAARDADVGWDKDAKRRNLYRVLDASVIGAVPPYSQLVGGKLVALATISRQTLDLVEAKYRGARTQIEKRVIDAPRPLLVTTTSALGRSSIYNRIRRPGRVFFKSVGSTRGFGHFAVPEDLFARLFTFLRQESPEKALAYEYGQGPSWRMRTLRVALEKLGVEPNRVLRHGIQREVFLAPTARNWRDVLRGEDAEPEWFNDDLADLAQFYRSRWAVPRSHRVPEYRQFDPKTLQLRGAARQAELR